MKEKEPIHREPVSDDGYARDGSFDEASSSYANSFIGIVNTACRADNLVRKCAARAKALFRSSDQNVEFPSVVVDGQLDAVFTYIPSHIEYMLFELLKNSMRFSIRRAELEGKDEDVTAAVVASPHVGPIRVTVAASETDIMFRVSDCAGGVDPSLLQSDNISNPSSSTKGEDTERLFSFASTSSEAFKRLKRLNDESQKSSDDNSSSKHAHVFSAALADPHVNLGLGLPMCRVYAQYWGGEVRVVSLGGHGTDVYLRISKLGNVLENLN
jgi:signal transduction histidine kinase